MSGCSSCGKSLAHRNLPRYEQPALNEHGIYNTLAGSSSVGYSGRFRNSTVHIVGYRTEYERVFKGHQGGLARDYAIHGDPNGKMRIVKAHATQLKSDVGLDVFGA